MAYVDNQNETSKTTRSPFWFTDEWKKGEDWQQVYRQTPAHKRFLYVRNDEMTDEDIKRLDKLLSDANVRRSIKPLRKLKDETIFKFGLMTNLS